ncbi:MAG: type IV pilus twitching motility protein PilT [Firmicutes bacterium]|nr:type IV pilus twitching motility protein PilT [Bacillota bacterium]
MNVDEILAEAVARHASDLHLTVDAPPSFRIHGEIVRGESALLTQSDTRRAFESLSGRRERTALDERGQVNFSYSIPGMGRFRVSAFRQRGSVALAIRILWPKVPTLGELCLPLAAAELAMRPGGLVLVAGPTGSGKSSTLAGMIDLINDSRSCHVITLEDPIEYLHSHKQSIVHQREIGQDAPSFDEGLRAALRQDPDVIMVGDIGDTETIQAALTAAETGHLVLGALHATGAQQSVSRIMDVFPPHRQQQVRVQVAEVLAGVIAQQLVPRIDRPGRIVACEILVATPAVRSLIRENRTHQLASAIQTGAKLGMRTMSQSLRDLCDKHVISVEEYQSRSASAPEREY